MKLSREIERRGNPNQGLEFQFYSHGNEYSYKTIYDVVIAIFIYLSMIIIIYVLKGNLRKNRNYIFMTSFLFF